METGNIGGIGGQDVEDLGVWSVDPDSTLKIILKDVLDDPLSPVSSATSCFQVETVVCLRCTTFCTYTTVC